MILHTDQAHRAGLEALIGWKAEPQGLCREDVCVPFALPDGDVLDLPSVAQALGRPWVAGDGVYALGPEAGRALRSAVLPDITLPDRKGEPFSLSSLRGRKLALIAWASW